MDEALSVLGDSVMQAIYFHLERSFNVKKEAIPHRLGTFAQAIENIFGAGARFIEILIMKNLHEKVDGVMKWNEFEEFGFLEYVAAARRLFKVKNRIETVQELIECETTEAEDCTTHPHFLIDSETEVE